MPLAIPSVVYIYIHTVVFEHLPCHFAPNNQPAAVYTLLFHFETVPRDAAVLTNGPDFGAHGEQTKSSSLNPSLPKPSYFYYLSSSSLGSKLSNPMLYLLRIFFLSL